MMKIIFVPIETQYSSISISNSILALILSFFDVDDVVLCVDG